MTDDIGGCLRRAREHRDMTLNDLARRTKLPIHVLQAIERNDFARLPGGMFRKAYVRTVASEVGLNPDEIAAAYHARFELPVEPQSVASPDAARQTEWIEQLTPSPRRSVVTLVALCVAGLAWFMFRPGPVRSNVPPRALPDGFPGIAVPIASPAPTPGVPLRIELAATGQCWVAAATDGERVLYRLVEPGEHVVLEAQRLISIRLGDAGSVMLSINDGARQSFGGPGEVVDLEVTPGNAHRYRAARLNDTVTVSTNGVGVPLSNRGS